MRKRISSPKLRARFDTAWAVLPKETQRKLRGLIRYVDECWGLEDTFIYGRPNGGRGDVEIIFGPVGPGLAFAAFMTLRSKDVCDILLATDLIENCTEPEVLATILHELGHAEDHYDNPIEAIAQGTFRSESIAWEKTIAWSEASAWSADVKHRIAIYVHFQRLADLGRLIESDLKN